VILKRLTGQEPRGVAHGGRETEGGGGGEEERKERGERVRAQRKTKSGGRSGGVGRAGSHDTRKIMGPIVDTRHVSNLFTRPNA
jgi:hypothetical protein